MCFDICTINIRVSIRVRGLHLVLNIFCMVFGLSPDSVLGTLSALSSKPAGLQRICMILGLNLDSICGS